MTWRYSRNPNSFEDAFFTAMVDKCLAMIKNNTVTARELYVKYHAGELNVPNGAALYNPKENKNFVLNSNGTFAYKMLSDIFGNKVIDEVARRGNIIHG